MIAALESKWHSNDSRVHGDNVLFVCPSGYVSALREAGFATTIAETPAAATKWPEKAAVLDVLVVDLLPELEDAWALIARGCAPPSRIPVMVLTSLVRPDGSNRRRARARLCRFCCKALLFVTTGGHCATRAARRTHRRLSAMPSQNYEDACLTSTAMLTATPVTSCGRMH